jgi:hypothetical protein
MSSCSQRAKIGRRGRGLRRTPLVRFKAEEMLAFGQFNNLDKVIPEDALNDLLR